MSMNTRTKTMIGGAAASLALLGLTAIPAFARSHNQSATTSASETTLTQAQATTPAQMNQQMMQNMQQMNRMMEQCNSMMSMMQNMPGMMNNQNNRPGQDMMNRTPRQ